MLQQDLFAGEPAALPTQERRSNLALGARLWALAEDHIYFGTSSWKYPAWKNSIYFDDYQTKVAFDKNCLTEYAKTFPAVGGDFSFYQWPHSSMLREIATQCPTKFRIVLKCTDLITMAHFPRIPRWKDLAGLQNPNFLNVDLFVEHFAGPCSAILGERLGPVLLEFTAFRDEIVTLGPELGHRISQFVKAVNLRFPEIQFAVEFRNRALAVPALFECLEPAVPAMTSWTRMIAIEEQWTRLLKLKRNWPFLMARPVLRPGKLKADADAQYSPFGRLHERITPMRATLIDMWQFARAHNIPSYFMISNTIEGCAHRTIAEIVESS